MLKRSFILKTESVLNIYTLSLFLPIDGRCNYCSQYITYIYVLITLRQLYFGNCVCVCLVLCVFVSFGCLTMSLSLCVCIWLFVCVLFLIVCVWVFDCVCLCVLVWKCGEPRYETLFERNLSSSLESISKPAFIWICCSLSTLSPFLPLCLVIYLSH